MVMLMIKFGAYKAACCWVCAPSFSRRQQLMTRREERRDDLGERENKAKNQVSEPKRLSSLLFSAPPQFSPPSPLPKKALSSPYTKGEEEGRERCRYHRKRLGHR